MIEKSKLIHFVPLSDDFLRNPHDKFLEMRSNCPIHISCDVGVRTVSFFNYEDSKNGLKNWQLYSSVIPEMKGLFLGEAEIIVQEDPPAHTINREIIKPLFSLENINYIINEFEIVFTQLICDSVGEKIEFVENIAAKSSLIITALMVGIPSSELDYIRDWVNRLSAATGAEFMQADKERTRNQIHNTKLLHAEFTTYLERLLPTISSPPKNSLLALLKEKNSSIDEMIAYCKLIIFTSNHTSSIQLTNAIFLSSIYPDQFEIVKEDKVFIPNLIEEIYRFKPVFRVLNRRIYKDCKINGVNLNKFDNILFWLSSANRDESVFKSPNVFDATRKNSAHHLSFGSGNHFCLGSVIAKKQLGVLIKVITERVGSIDIISPPDIIKDPWVDAFNSLHIRMNKL